ncbi:MAG TPA: hypothetical protein PLY41_05220 [Acetomicrobium sp.]|nr:hypothetical protein [Acetomicrobium sp.]
MKNAKKNSMIAMLVVVIAISLAIFAGDTVMLTVTEKNASVDGKWDPLSGQNMEKRYIKVNAGSKVELQSDGSVKSNIGCLNVVINPNDKLNCNTSCDLDPSSGYHKLHTSGHYTVSGSGGAGEGKKMVWNATGRTEGKFEIKSFDSVRRRYGDNDPGEVTKISVKGEKGVVYKLRIERIFGDKGDAAFDAAGTQREMDYTGTGGFTQISLYGIEESTAEHNMKITGIKDGKVLDEQKFIVFSEIKYEFNSQETQHKDTDAPCTKCDAQWRKLNLPRWRRHAHNVDGDINNGFEPCDHISYLEFCDHCENYCARACLKVIYGGHQDWYLQEETTTVEENHEEGLTFNSIQFYAIKNGDVLRNIKKPNYQQLYEELLVVKRSISDFGLHAIILHGAYQNKQDGTVTGPMVYAWDPQRDAGTPGNRECYLSSIHAIFPKIVLPLPN